MAVRQIVGQVGGLWSSIWNKVTGAVDGGVKKAAEQGAKADSSAVGNLMQDWYKSNPKATPEMIQRQKDFFAHNIGGGTSAMERTLSDNSFRRKLGFGGKALAVTGALTATGAATALITSGMTAWENSQREAGTNAWYHGILAFLKKGMELLGLDKKMPDAHKWLSEKMDENKGPIQKLVEPAKKILAPAGSAVTSLEKFVPDFLDGGSETYALVETAGVTAVGALAAKKFFGGRGGHGGGDGAPPKIPGGGGAPSSPATRAGSNAVLAAEEGSEGILKSIFSKVAGSKLGKFALGATVAGVAAIGTISIAKADDGVTPQPGTKPDADVGILDQGLNFAKGLVNDASPSNWSIKGGANLVHAAGHGFVNGTAYLGSFAYANTIGWLTGQSSEDVHKEYLGKAVNTAFENTIGMPDLSGHWAQAANFAGEMAMPSKAAATVGIKLVQAFNLAEKTSTLAKAAKIGIHGGTQFAVGGPGAPAMP